MGKKMKGLKQIDKASRLAAVVEVVVGSKHVEKKSCKRKDMKKKHVKNILEEKDNQKIKICLQCSWFTG